MSKEKRTYADRSQYIKKAVTERRINLKVKAKEYKGSKCEICGYNNCFEALDFHHLDPSIKSFGLSAKGITRSWDKIKDEIEKCVLICANCHRELHAGITQLPAVMQVENKVNSVKP